MPKRKDPPLDLSDISALPDVLTALEAAKILRISKGHAYAMINSGELRAVRLGHRLLIPKSVVIDLLSPRDAG